MEILTFLYQNYGAFFDLVGAGITGPVQLKGQNGTTVDLSSQQWTYQVSLCFPCFLCTPDLVQENGNYCNLCNPKYMTG